MVRWAFAGLGGVVALAGGWLFLPDLLRPAMPPESPPLVAGAAATSAGPAAAAAGGGPASGTVANAAATAASGAASAPAAIAPAGATAAIAPAVAPPREPPRFDVVRVGARGAAVVAGRATPGAEIVLLLDGDQEIGRARADPRGEWLILPAEPLAPGARELSLRARLAGEETPGLDTVVVVVPEPSGTPAPTALAAVRTAPSSRAALPTPPPNHAPPPRAAEAPQSPPPAAPASVPPGPLAVLLPSAASPSAPPAVVAPGQSASSSAGLPRLLQVPEPPPRPDGNGARVATGLGVPPARLGLEVVDYDEAGAMRFAGTAMPGAAVRIYVNERHAGDTRADAAGRWTLTPAPAAAPSHGRHTLRVDQLAASGSVAARIEVPFQRDRLPEPAFAPGSRVVVQPGHSLWHIARQTYGQGVRFTVIYQANRDQIRDPDRIYPGQIFALPLPDEPGQPVPAASSVAR